MDVILSAEIGQVSVPGLEEALILGVLQSVVMS